MARPMAEHLREYVLPDYKTVKKGFVRGPDTVLDDE